jgi:hypothetical protein
MKFLRSKYILGITDWEILSLYAFYDSSGSLEFINNLVSIRISKLERSSTDVSIVV